MTVDITQALSDKMKDYCLINATQYSSDTSTTTRANRYIAEEAHSKVMIKIWERNVANKWEEKHCNDNYYFIMCKMTILNQITTENAKKRQSYLDFNNLSLDKELDEGYKFDLSDEIDIHKKEEDDLFETKLKFVVNTLSDCVHITDFDVEIFYFCFLKRGTILTAAKNFKCSIQTVSNSRLRIKNTIKYLWLK